MAQTHLPERWIERTCDLLEVPLTHEVLRFFTAWQRAEGGTAKWNPLNSTLKLDGTVSWTETVDYNSIPVRNYKYAIVGVVATVLTLQQRKQDGTLLYAGLVTGLRQAKGLGKTAEQLVGDNQAQIKLWGTSPQTMLDVLAGIA